MFGGINPKKMQAMMKQMGMSQEEIDAAKVIIEKNDGTRVIIEDPSVSKINFQGQETYQISGESIEETAEEGISEEDISTVMEKTGCDKEKAEEILEETGGDLAEAILRLSE
jgi:nascent polypeptide-associated complex subunit alpha